MKETTRPGDATRLATEARSDGVECIAVVGGDGTLNEISQAYLGSDGAPVTGPDIAIIPAGTGGDFRKTFALSDEAGVAVERLADAEPRPLDLGILELTGDDGEPSRRAFLNITSFGLGGLTDRIVNDSPKWMGGTAAFYLGALRAMLAYRNARVTLRVDGEQLYEGPILNVAMANGRYFGGGMMVAPDADPSDGMFDVVVLGDMTRTETLSLTGKIYKGTHIGTPKVSVRRGRLVEATPVRSDAKVLIDMDGETPGRLPLTARVAAAALRIRA